MVFTRYGSRTENAGRDNRSRGPTSPRLRAVSSGFKQAVLGEPGRDFIPPGQFHLRHCLFEAGRHESPDIWRSSRLAASEVTRRTSTQVFREPGASCLTSSYDVKPTDSIEDASPN